MYFKNKRLFILRLTLSTLASCFLLSIYAQTISYTESFEDFVNPDRGFYKPMHVKASQFESLKLANLQSIRNTPFTPYMGNYSVKTSLVYRQYLLDSFIGTNTLSQTFLNNLETDFNIARQAGIRLIVRFAYIDGPRPGCGDDPCPPYGDVSKTRILSHINQLKPYLQAHSDVLSVVQSGFIGVWGEQYYTDHFGDASGLGQGKLTNANWADREEVLAAVLDAVPTSRMVQVRYPQLKQRYIYGSNALVTADAVSTTQAHKGTDIARIGFHNDCFLSSDDDYGTYFDYGNDNSGASNQINYLKPYFANDSKYTCVGGETCNDDDFSPENNCSGQTISDMEYLHYSFLNSDYQNEVNNDWQDDGCMNEIKRRLGYRFVLLNGSYPTTAAAGETINFTLNLKNVGFAAPFNPRALQLVLRNTANNQEHKLSITGANTDSRFWLPGTISLNGTVDLPNNLPDGTYQLLLHILDTSNNNEVADRPEYSIRLANTGTWEANTGYNQLNHNLTISSSYPICVTIDGGFTDWNEINASSTSGSGGLNNLKAADGTALLYLFAGTSINTNYQFFLDSDNNATGSNEFRNSNWSNTGFNYLLENGILYHYTGTGTDWSWSEANTFDAVKNTSGVEVAIFKSQLSNLGSTINIGFVSLDANWMDVGQIPLSTNGSSYSLTSQLNCDCSDDNLILSRHLTTDQAYETDGTISSTQNISGSTAVTYDSKTAILLEAGFAVATGTSFHAFIDGCDVAELSDKEVTHFSKKEVKATPSMELLNLSISPNPFKHHFTINYHLSTPNFSTLTIYNALGKKIAQPLARQWQAQNSYTYTIDGALFPKGLYLLVLQNGETIYTKKVMAE